MRSSLFYMIAVVVVIADQISKWAVMSTVPMGSSLPVLGPLLALTPTYNTGGAFSLLQTRNSVFIVVAVAAIVALSLAFHRYQRGNLAVSAALTLAMGGAVGNVIDRIRFGHVQDFFDIHVWPIFNVADSAIVVGIVLLTWNALFGKPAPDPVRHTGA